MLDQVMMPRIVQQNTPRPVDETRDTRHAQVATLDNRESFIGHASPRFAPSG
jgi:hypothetical protein